MSHAPAPPHGTNMMRHGSADTHGDARGLTDQIQTLRRTVEQQRHKIAALEDAAHAQV
jgi:hypothetical protein